MAASAKSTYVVRTSVNEDEQEVKDVTRVEFLPGQNRVVFYNGEDPVASFTGPGLQYWKK